MNPWDIFVGMLGGAGTVFAATWFLGKKLVDHLFARDLTEHKARLDAQAARELADLKAKLDTQVGKELAAYKAGLDAQGARELADLKAKLDTHAGKELAAYKADLDAVVAKDLAEYKSTLDVKNARDLGDYKVKLELYSEGIKEYSSEQAYALRQAYLLLYEPHSSMHGSADKDKDARLEDAIQLVMHPLRKHLGRLDEPTIRRIYEVQKELLDLRGKSPEEFRKQKNHLFNATEVARQWVKADRIALRLGLIRSALDSTEHG
jgi:hypothetical protein